MSFRRLSDLGRERRAVKGERRLTAIFESMVRDGYDEWNAARSTAQSASDLGVSEEGLHRFLAQPQVFDLMEAHLEDDPEARYFMSFFVEFQPK